MEVPGRRSLRTRPLLVAAAALTVIFGLPACSSNSSVAPPEPPRDSTAGRTILAQQTLTELQTALAARDADKATALADDSARDLLQVVTRNADTLDLRDLSLRIVDDQSTMDEGDRERYGAKAWAGSVAVAYRMHGWDRQPIRLETRFIFLPSAGRELIAGIGGGDDRTPLWVTGPVTRLVAGRALVIARGDGGERCLRLASQALVDVHRVLPAWRGRLVVEAPATEDELDQALAAPQTQYANIAAVTTTPDGSLVPGSPVHVFLNPEVFKGLGPRGAQVVLSHETTHVATDAVFADLPTWLLEGFADYVALAHAGIPVGTAASQVLARIRKDGPPDHLPTSAELAPTANDLGATYEEAWLTTRFISREYGEARLVDFYQKVSAGESVDDAFQRILGTTQAAFVERWRADLKDLAGGVAG